MLAVRAPLRILEDLAAAVGARDGRFVFLLVRPILVLGVVHHPGIVVFPVAPSGHGRASSSEVRGASDDARPIRGHKTPIVSRRRTTCQPVASDVRADLGSVQRGQYANKANDGPIVVGGAIPMAGADDERRYVARRSSPPREVAGVIEEPPVRYAPPAIDGRPAGHGVHAGPHGDGTLRIVMLERQHGSTETFGSGADRTASMPEVGSIPTTFWTRDRLLVVRDRRRVTRVRPRVRPWSTRLRQGAGHPDGCRGGLPPGGRRRVRPGTGRAAAENLRNYRGRHSGDGPPRRCDRLPDPPGRSSSSCSTLRRPVLEAVADNIRRSFAKDPRHMHGAYQIPQPGSPFGAAPVRRRVGP